MPTDETARTNSPPIPNADEDTYDDDYEEEDRDPHAALVDSVRSDNRNNREALAYLLRYETMVRQQEAEDMATLAHLRPCLERLKELLPKEWQESTSPSKDKDQPVTTEKDLTDDTIWTKEISYASLGKALEILELQGPTEFMTTDRQLMMILRLLTQSTAHRSDKATLTWAELVQCYKTCIIGMTTLQHLPNANDTRQRARDRTLAMLALFEPQSRLFSSPLAPVRPTASTRALSLTQRSSFAPPRAVKRRRNRRLWILAGVSLLLIAAGLFYYPQPAQDAATSQSHEIPTKHSNSKRSAKPTSNTSKPAPTFSVRSLVPSATVAAPSMKTPTASMASSDLYYHEDEEEEMGVAGPALLVATVGTPFVVVLTQTLLQQMGIGAAFVAATSSISAFGHAMVTVAGVISLTSMVYQSLRALFRGLGRLAKGDKA